MPVSSPLRIGLLLYPGCMPAGLFAFADLMWAANRRSGQALFDLKFIALRRGSVKCAHGMVLTAAGALSDADFDAVLIPGFWAESAQHVADGRIANAALIATLTTLPKETMLWSYCTGVSLLAAAGKLNGQKATVTWWLADEMRRYTRKVFWQNEQICVFNARTATASGVNGYLPIAQTLIEKRVSIETYRELSKLMLLPRPERLHAAFQSLNLIELSDPLVRKFHMLVEQLPADEITVQRLARKLHMAERTLARKIGLATGQPVASYARRIKLNQVSERLILTSAPASTISMELGFRDDAGMRRMFKQLTAFTPNAYRQSFGQKCASEDD